MVVSVRSLYIPRLPLLVGVGLALAKILVPVFVGFRILGCRVFKV